MTAEVDPGANTLSPAAAFSVLGNETRMAILQRLGEAEAPASFSELRDRVGIKQGGEFNYHLNELVGHFVRKTEAGYELSQAGRRVIMAVHSGAVTETPELEPTVTDEACWYCGAPIMISFREERVDMYCSECPGTFGTRFREERETVTSVGEGYLGYVSLPPAGLQYRTPVEVFRAAWTWHHLDMLAVGSGTCPRCSAAIHVSVDACEEHESAGGLCGACERTHAIDFRARCTNCIFETGGPFMLALLAETDLLAFLTSHGRNPVTLESIATGQGAHVKPGGASYDETLLSTEPFRARFSFTIAGEALTLTVDEDFSVVSAAMDRSPDS